MATPREQLADELKKARLAAGFDSCAELARQINISRPQVSKAESPSQPVPSDGLLVAWSGATGAPLDPFMELAQQARGGSPTWAVPYLRAESVATTLRFWNPLLVPGLLHTEAYARALLTVEGHAPARVEELLKVRMARAAVLGRARITVVVAERVLRHQLGTPAVMAEQLGHLVSLVKSGAIRVHVVPDDASVGLGGALAIAVSDGSTVVSLTTTIKDITTSTAEDVTDAVDTFEIILGAAMPVDQSLDFLVTEEEQWQQKASNSTGGRRATATVAKLASKRPALPEPS